jgi:hypothetical protein
MRQAREAVVIALDFVALDPTIEHHDVGARGRPKHELLDNARIWVGYVKPCRAHTESLTEI